MDFENSALCLRVLGSDSGLDSCTDLLPRCSAVHCCNPLAIYTYSKGVTKPSGFIFSAATSPISRTSLV